MKYTGVNRLFVRSNGYKFLLYMAHALFIVVVGFAAYYVSRNEFDFSYPPRKPATVEMVPERIVYQRLVYDEPHLVAHVISIPHDERFNVRVSAPDWESGAYRAQTVRKYVQDNPEVIAAINGSFFTPFWAGWMFNYPQVGDHVYPRGQVEIEGIQVSQPEEGYSVLCLTKPPQIVEFTCPAGTLYAMAGKNILVKDGTAYDVGGTLRHPRAAVGLTQTGMVFMAIDGRQSYSAGATLEETAALLIEQNVLNGLLVDGGGSTTQVYRASGSVVVATTPVNHFPVTGRLRPVGPILYVTAAGPPDKVE